MPSTHISTHQPDPMRPCNLCGNDSSISLRVGDTRHYLCDACAGPDLAHNVAFNSRVLAAANMFRPEHAETVTSLPVDSPQLRAALPAVLQKLGYDHDTITAALGNIHIEVA